MSQFTESVVEEATFEWLEGLGYANLHGPEIAASEPYAEGDKSSNNNVLTGAAF
jgi:hypothetical protein